MFLRERRRRGFPIKLTSPRYAEIGARTVCLRFALAAMGSIGAGIWLAAVGDEIGQVTGWNASFIGSLFLSVTTSAPELVVTTAALRLGAIDMAIADVLGANMLDIAIIAPVDLSYRRGLVLSAASRSHLTTAAALVVMNLIVIGGLKLRHKHKALRIASWYGPILVSL